MKSVVVVHKFSLQKDSITELLKYNNIIVFEVDSNSDLFKILEVMIPNLIITIIDSQLDKKTAHEIYNNILDRPFARTVPMLFYNILDRECFLCWRRTNLMEQETHIFENCQSQQILETVRKILEVQKKKLQALN